jgi:hypothetical protein
VLAGILLLFKTRYLLKLLMPVDVEDCLGAPVDTRFSTLVAFLVGCALLMMTVNHVAKLFFPQHLPSVADGISLALRLGISLLLLLNPQFLVRGLK